MSDEILHFGVNAGFIITFVALITNWINNWASSYYKRSEFFLNEIKSNFNNTINILSECENKNIKWHNAINSLISAVNLSRNLTNKAHKQIYCVWYVDTVFKIADILVSIDSFKYFYGIRDYGGLSSRELYSRCNRINVRTGADKGTLLECHRISLELLSFLCRFLSKSNYIKFQEMPKYDRKRFMLLSQPIDCSLLTIKEQDMYLLNATLIINYIQDFKMHMKQGDCAASGENEAQAGVQAA